MRPETKKCSRGQDRFIIKGCQNVPGFEAVALGGKVAGMQLLQVLGSHLRFTQLMLWALRFQVHLDASSGTSAANAKVPLEVVQPGIVQLVQEISKR